MPDPNPIPPTNPSPEEPTPMLEVHPPHHTVSTWRDFFIHIATIVVGLLIAVGIEQAVESIHHHHQLHQIEADLHVEAVSNQSVGTRNLAQINRDLSWLLQLRTRVDAIRGGAPRSTFIYPPHIHGYPGDPADNDRILPSVAVWDAVRQNGLIDLLPRDEAIIYAKFYRISDIFDVSFARLRDDWRKLSAFELQFAVGPPGTQPDINRMSSLQLDQYSALLAEVFLSAQDVKRHLQIQIAWNEGAVSLQVPLIGEYLRTHPDPIPAETPSPDRPSTL